jgi:hypothetical protein
MDEQPSIEGCFFYNKSVIYKVPFTVFLERVIEALSFFGDCRFLVSFV